MTTWQSVSLQTLIYRTDLTGAGAIPLCFFKETAGPFDPAVNICLLAALQAAQNAADQRSAHFPADGIEGGVGAALLVVDAESQRAGHPVVQLNRNGFGNQ